MQGSISLQSDIEMIITRIRQCVEPEDSNSKVKELESSLFGEIRMATYAIGRCHGSFVCAEYCVLDAARSYKRVGPLL